MNPTALLIATLVVLPAAGLVGWVWFAMVQVERDLQTFSGFDGLHLEP